MNIDQVLVELVTPFKKLVELVKPKQQDTWFAFKEVGDVQMSVDYHTQAGYTFLVTYKQELGIKVRADKSFINFNTPITVGKPDDILAMVIRAVNHLETKQ